MRQLSSAERLITELGRHVASVAGLLPVLGGSQPSLSRMLRRLIREGQVVRIGTTRGARYGLLRILPDTGSTWPLHRVTRQGEIEELGMVHALAANQYYIELSDGAISAGLLQGGGLLQGSVTDGLPYFLHDQRPGGFLGRAVPVRYPELNLPQRVIDWSDDHYLRYLTRHGADTVGDLILGERALDEYLAAQRQRPIISHTEREARYPQLALDVMQGGLPGSSAHGENPKFAVMIGESTVQRAVLVKFSPPIATPLGRRWSDLLNAEHQAHLLLRAAGLPACTSRVFTFADRTYLEVDRFDRAGSDGRIGATSLMAIDSAAHAGLDNWVAAAKRMHADRRIDALTLEQVRLAATFGELIANTDRHFGNLMFYDDYRGQFRLAPLYDMLPMFFAPQNDQIFARVFVPPDPTANSHRAWSQARTLAQRYWEILAEDVNISKEFRRISAACLIGLKARATIGVNS